MPIGGTLPQPRYRARPIRALVSWPEVKEANELLPRLLIYRAKFYILGLPLGVPAPFT